MRGSWNRGSHGAWATAYALVIACCTPDGGGDLDSLHRVLAEDRQAHLQRDPGLIAAHLADTLISVDDGRITRQPRADVEAQFRSYFGGATYHAWDDATPPSVRIAPGGRMAWVVRSVRVDREEPCSGGGRQQRRFVSAWTATYEWRQGRWQMTTVTSTFVPEPTAAQRILVAAARRLGGADRLAGLATLRATAAAEGPGGVFIVHVRSARDGRVRLDFEGGMSAAIGKESTWLVEAPGTTPAELSPELQTFVRGHEVHMNILAPESRYGPLHFTGVAEFEGKPALRLTGLDALQAAAEFYYSRTDTMPLGYSVADHLRRRSAPTVEVGDWEDRDGVLLFRSATFRQDAEVFRYRFAEVDVDVPGADSLFAAPN